MNYNSIVNQILKDHAGDKKLPIIIMQLINHLLIKHPHFIDNELNNEWQNIFYENLDAFIFFFTTLPDKLRNDNLIKEIEHVQNQFELLNSEVSANQSKLDFLNQDLNSLRSYQNTLKNIIELEEIVRNKHFDILKIRSDEDLKIAATLNDFIKLNFKIDTLERLITDIELELKGNIISYEELLEKIKSQSEVNNG